MKLGSISKQFKTGIKFIVKYRVGVLALLTLIIFSFTVYRINYLSAAKRDEEIYQEKLSSVKKINFDQTVINDILQLKNTGVNVRSNYPINRTNPF